MALERKLPKLRKISEIDKKDFLFDKKRVDDRKAANKKIVSKIRKVVKVKESKLDLWQKLANRDINPKNINEVQATRRLLEANMTEIEAEIANPRSLFSKQKLFDLMATLRRKNDSLKKVMAERAQNVNVHAGYRAPKAPQRISENITLDSSRGRSTALDAFSGETPIEKRERLARERFERERRVNKEVEDERAANRNSGRDLESERRAARERDADADERLRTSGLDPRTRPSGELITGPKRNEDARIVKPIPHEDARVFVKGTEFETRRAREELELDGRGPKPEPKQLELDLDYSIKELKKGATIESVSDKVQQITFLINQIINNRTSVRISESSVTEIINRIEELKVSISEEDYNKLVKELVSKLETSNEYLYTRLATRFEPILKRIEKNTTESNERLKSLNKAIATLMNNLSAEGKANKEQIIAEIEELKREVATYDGQNKGTLKRIEDRLRGMEQYFSPIGFGMFLREIVRDAFRTEITELVNTLIERFSEKYPDLEKFGKQLEDIEAALNGLAGLTQETRKDILESIDILFDAEFENTKKVLDAIEKIKQYFGTDDFKKIIIDAVLEGIEKNNSKLLDALFNDPRFKDLKETLNVIQNMISGIYPEIRKNRTIMRDQIIPRLENLLDMMSIDNDAMAKAMNELKTAIETTNALINGLRPEILRNREIMENEIIPRLENLLDMVSVDNTQIMNTLEELRQFMTGKGMEDLIEKVVKKALTENNATLVNDIKAALPDLLKGLVKDEDVKKLLEKIEKLEKTVGENQEKIMKELSEIKEAVKKGGGGTPKPEEPGKWKNFWGSVGKLGIVLALAGFGVAMVLIAAKSAGSSGSKMVSITPVIGEAAKTSSASGSLLGSLGGINPLIIILILVALFLLFPKK